MTKPNPLWQAKNLALIGGFALVLALGACGKKANHVNAPPGVDDDRFPLTYPDPATDPQPAKNSQ